jgi:asparagine synthase (glutamine-hydrolysing)
LSGGLDSRVILACHADRASGLAFTCFDEPNREFRTAGAVAAALSVPFLGLRRGADYYADSAEAGVRISGGMGSFANNHFLGAMPRLEAEGVDGLLTGCYCDYLFKGLPLNRRRVGPAGREELGPFRHQFYFDHFEAPTVLAARARDRVESRVPRDVRTLDTPASVFEVERYRTFPLCYEGDNQQRVVPQRVSGWCPPFVDRDVLDVYCRTPYHYKLDRALFKRVTVGLTPELHAIPDANTGAPAGAGLIWERVRVADLRVRRRWQRWRRPSASDESWPSWHEYVARSPKLGALWHRPNQEADDLFRRILGTDGVDADPRTYKGKRLFLFLGLLTVKLWLDQRQ